MTIAPAEWDALHDAAREKLSVFTRLSWPELNRGTSLIWARHTDAICEHLEAVSSGEIRKLIICVPPGCSKTTLASQTWPVWHWLKAPHTRWGFSAYAGDLSKRDSVKRRDLINSNWFQSAFAPDWQIKSDESLKMVFANTVSGEMRAMSVGGAATGFHFDFLVTDDALRAMDIYTARLGQSVKWYEEQWASRLRDPDRSAQVIIAQRLHDRDLPGVKAADPTWTVLRLAMEYEKSYHCSTRIGWEDWRTTEGEPLCPQRFGHEFIAEKKKNARVWASQYQQRPKVGDGTIVRAGWLRFYYLDEPIDGAIPYPGDAAMERWVGAWDMTFDGGAKADFAVGQVFARRGPIVFLMDQIREQMRFTEQRRAALRLGRKWPEVRRWLIEKAANGAAIMDTLRRPMSREDGGDEDMNGLPGMVPVIAREPKVARFEAIASYFEAGNVVLPHPDIAPWVAAYCSELTEFPTGANDDQCIPPDTLLPIVRHDDKEAYDVNNHADSTMLVQASEIQVGDSVLTHRGRLRPVTQVFRRHHDGPVSVIRPCGARPWKLTPEHPVYCVRGERKFVNGAPYGMRPVGDVGWVPAAQVNAGDYVVVAVDSSVEDRESIDIMDWVDPARLASDGPTNRQNNMQFSKLIVTDDWIRFANPRSNPVPRRVAVTEDLCRFFGYYIADGSCGAHSVAFSMGAHKQRNIDDAMGLLSSLFCLKFGSKTLGGATVLSVSSKILRDVFQQFGRRAENKHIPEWMMRLPLPLQTALVAGMWRSDGCVAANGTLHYSTASATLSAGLQRILYRMGFVPAVSMLRPNGGPPITIKGKTTGPIRPIYQTNLSGKAAVRLGRLLGLAVEDKKEGREPHNIVRDGLVLRRVMEVGLEDYEGDVLNFEVEEDHSYQLESFVVHNCDATAMALKDIFRNSAVTDADYDAILPNARTLHLPDGVSDPREAEREIEEAREMALMEENEKRRERERIADRLGFDFNPGGGFSTRR